MAKKTFAAEYVNQATLKIEKLTFDNHLKAYFGTVTLRNFRDAFMETGRVDNFSAAGLEALYNHLHQSAEKYNQEMAVNVNALCSEYTEYASMEAMLASYPAECSSLASLRDYTDVIDIPGGGYIVQAL